MENLELVQKRSPLGLVLALVKPRIIELLLVTAVPVLVLASNGWPNWEMLASVVIFGTLAAAGANAWNSIIERETDALMNRTKMRPLVTGELRMIHAVAIALILTVISILGMYVTTNFAAAALTAAAIGFYVLGYTILLKPRTNQNIVWGGIAGCFPVVIADAAVLGAVSVAGWILFALVFFWTPAHYWPLAAHLKEDYALAQIPMLPVAKPEKTVAGWTLFYTFMTIVTSLVFYFIVEMGLIYLVAAIVAGGVFLGLSYNYYRSADSIKPMSSMIVFHYSISYLAVIFVSIAVDVLL